MGADAKEKGDKEEVEGVEAELQGSRIWESLVTAGSCLPEQKEGWGREKSQ